MVLYLEGKKEILGPYLRSLMLKPWPNGIRSIAPFVQIEINEKMLIIIWFLPNDFSN